jgi:hypothetical protein
MNIESFMKRDGEACTGLTQLLRIEKGGGVVGSTKCGEFLD